MTQHKSNQDGKKVLRVNDEMYKTGVFFKKKQKLKDLLTTSFNPHVTTLYMHISPGVN